MPPRILHLISPSGLYGAERVVLNWLGRLNRDHAFSLAHFHKPGPAVEEFLAAARDLGARTIPLPDALSALPQAGRQLLRTVRREKADLLHAHGYKAVALAGLVSPWLKLPVVVSQHGFVSGSVKLRLYNRLDRLVCALGGADRVLCVSEEIMDSYRQAGVPEERLVRLANAVPAPARPPVFPPEATEPLPPGLPDWIWGERVLACVGRLSPEKGQAELLKALPAILAAHPRALLLLVGDGPDRAALAALAERLGVAGRTVFAGFRSDAGACIRWAEALVLPSLTEGLPMVVLEAMAMARPVAASAVGDLPRLITPGVHGLLSSPGDSVALAANVIELLDDPDRARHMGRQGWRKVREDHDLDGQARTVADLYRELIRGRLRPVPLRLASKAAAGQGSSAGPASRPAARQPDASSRPRPGGQPPVRLLHLPKRQEDGRS